jgi:hypothetical protein
MAHMSALSLSLTHFSNRDVLRCALPMPALAGSRSPAGSLLRSHATRRAVDPPPPPSPTLPWTTGPDPH